MIGSIPVTSLVGTQPVVTGEVVEVVGDPEPMSSVVTSGTEVGGGVGTQSPIVKAEVSGVTALLKMTTRTETKPRIASIPIKVNRP